MNFTELKTATETVTGSSNDTGRYLNKAQKLLAQNSATKESVSVAVTAGVITIPADCLVPRDIKYNTRSLNQGQKTMAVSDSTTTDPSEWVKRNGRIELNTSVTCTADGTAVLYFTPRPATMSGTDNPELTDCDDALIAYARYKLYSDVEDEDSAAYWESEWFKERQDWIDLNGIQDYEVDTIENVTGW